MTLSAEDVRVAVTGAVYLAPTGTTLPTSPTASPNAAFEDLGYISEDGITQTIDESVTPIKAWQNGDTVRKVQDSHELSYAMTFLETSDEVLEAYYGNYSAGTVEIRGDNSTRGPWIIDVIDGGDIIRIVIPDGQVTDRGDITYANNNAVMYPVTIECYPDSDGTKAYLYLLGTGS